MKTVPIHFGISVVIPRIIEFGMARRPNEACGLVIPNLDKPADDWVVEMTNKAANPFGSYEIDGDTLKSLELSPEVWADVLVWHTHPRGQVGPSRGDIEMKRTGLKYLVVSLPRGEAVMF